MSARIAAFLVWALAAACVVYWAMRLLAAPAGLPASVQPVSIAGALRGDVGRLFTSPVAPAGAPVAAPALASRFKLVGVMAPRAEGPQGGRQGIALIAVDGKPARAYRIGAALDEALVLQAVAKRSATLGPVDGAALVTLDLPVQPAPATGTLPSISLPGLSLGGMRPVPVPAAGPGTNDAMEAPPPEPPQQAPGNTNDH